MSVNDVGRVFGRGIAFPPKLGREVTVAWSEGAQNIRESIRVILLTNRGERVMLAEFGAGLQRFLFRPNTVETRRLITEEVTNALERWEPRIRLKEVEVTADPQEAHGAIIAIRYELLANRAIEEMQLRLLLNREA